jgi:hypothetical protein
MVCAVGVCIILLIGAGVCNLDLTQHRLFEKFVYIWMTGCIVVAGGGMMLVFLKVLYTLCKLAIEELR